MELKLRGKVHEGTVVFQEPLKLPEGTEVLASIEPVVEQRQFAPPGETVDLLSLPFVGMYADREDMKDSVAWVNKERAKWHQRSQRRD